MSHLFIVLSELKRQFKAYRLFSLLYLNQKKTTLLTLLFLIDFFLVFYQFINCGPNQIAWFFKIEIIQ